MYTIERQRDSEPQQLANTGQLSESINLIISQFALTISVVRRHAVQKLLWGRVGSCKSMPQAVDKDDRDIGGRETDCERESDKRTVADVWLLHYFLLHLPRLVLIACPYQSVDHTRSVSNDFH